MNSKNIFKIGEHVKVINDTMTGIIIDVNNEKIGIECTDGFNYSFDSKELVHATDWNDSLNNILIDQKSSTDKKKHFKSKKGVLIKEIDLHIHELIDSEKGMSNYDKLSLQLKIAKVNLEEAIQKKHSKIIFIHGKGAGVLKKELRQLCSKYPVSFHDASYTEYGFGATEVIIFQNMK